MRIFPDTNVLLDVFTVRQPYYAAACMVWNRAEAERLEGFAC